MIIRKDNLASLLDAASQAQTVYVPVEGNGTTFFAPYEPAMLATPEAADAQLRLDLQNTQQPPKELLFPATEKMFRWKRHEGELAIEAVEAASEPFVIFGARPCDADAIERLDQVFLTKGYVDEYYEARRNAATIVVLACRSAAPTCFCSSMGGAPDGTTCADVLLREGDDIYSVEALTDKGTALVDAWAPHLAEGEVDAPVPELALQVNMEGVADKLNGMFDDPLWQEVSDSCITCGTCTFVCPTCYCFDISQDRRADEGSRFRCWDSCMFTDYTLMAGGHNPRATKQSRVRQRFMHKLCYFEERYGESLCVGCGRCIVDCPAAVDISLIIDRIGAE